MFVSFTGSGTLLLKNKENNDIVQLCQLSLCLLYFPWAAPKAAHSRADRLQEEQLARRCVDAQRVKWGRLLQCATLHCLDLESQLKGQVQGRRIRGETAFWCTVKLAEYTAILKVAFITAANTTAFNASCRLLVDMCIGHSCLRNDVVPDGPTGITTQGDQCHT